MIKETYQHIQSDPEATHSIESTSQVFNGNSRSLFEQSVVNQQVALLGEVMIRGDIKSSLSPFLVLPEYRTQYPEVVTKALGNLHAEYNQAFRPLVAANKEWDTDYQYCLAQDGTPINGWVQIDMVGLPDDFLKATPHLGEREVREVLRGKIFEIENSLAMYQLLEKIFSHNGQSTLFKKQFRASLDESRKKHNMPIALLAVTDQKFQAMRASEFGKSADEPLTDTEVMELSGFDRFFGPEEFKQYLTENGGRCDYLLYARTSDPVAKLKKPDLVVENPLLVDPEMRKIIKAHAITFNIDAPEMDPARRINDTKAYLPIMGMAHAVHSDSDIFSLEFTAYLSQSNPYAAYTSKDILSPQFATYLRSQGVDPAMVASGETMLRAKPMKGTYGCYGHVSGALSDKRFRQELRQNLRNRGDYVIQPEMKTPTIVNEKDRRAYTYIERVFLHTDGHNHRFMGGFRSLMPLGTTEANNGRNHGSKYTVWAEIS